METDSYSGGRSRIQILPILLIFILISISTRAQSNSDSIISNLPRGVSPKGKSSSISLLFLSPSQSLTFSLPLPPSPSLQTHNSTNQLQTTPSNVIQHLKPFHSLQSMTIIAIVKMVQMNLELLLALIRSTRTRLATNQKGSGVRIKVMKKPGF